MKIEIDNYTDIDCCESFERPLFAVYWHGHNASTAKAKARHTKYMAWRTKVGFLNWDDFSYCYLHVSVLKYRYGIRLELR